MSFELLVRKVGTGKASMQSVDNSFGKSEYNGSPLILAGQSETDCTNKSEPVNLYF